MGNKKISSPCEIKLLTKMSPKFDVKKKRKDWRHSYLRYQIYDYDFYFWVQKGDLSFPSELC